MYVCNCAGVTKKEIEIAIAGGANSLQALRQTLNVANDCCQCACDVKKCLQQGQDKASCQPALNDLAFN
jgi:bacterioferritin-associated ferredoxin